ncbi:stretch-activated cation channel Mid1 [Lipomyces oligophaga]|uniref:stretch-activated cation channel Mid1 n=1 Tax=Lipomyces oligophaga TaxID=45792 RepID=UPI0034CFD14D
MLVGVYCQELGPSRTNRFLGNIPFLRETSEDNSNISRISRGKSLSFKGELDLESGSVYLVIGVCSQPSYDSEQVTEAEVVQDLPLIANILKHNVTFTQGLYKVHFNTLQNPDIKIFAPEYDESKYSGGWTFTIYEANSKTLLGFRNISNGITLLDADNSSALFLTTPLPDTEQFSDNDTAIYNTYIYKANDPSLWGLSESYCAVSNGNYVANDSNADISYTTKLLGDESRQLVLMRDLEKNTRYDAYLALRESDDDSPTGILFPMISFSTADSDACELIYDLDFCSEVAYSVPSGLDLSNSELKVKYDSYAAAQYEGFNKSLQIVPCNVSNADQYSLMRTCSDCADSYKRWLCLTVIPRCFTQPDNAAISLQGSYEGGSENDAVSGLRVRTNNSRNAFVNSLEPKNYTELLPCSYTCHKVMQDCPVQLQFQCASVHRGLYDSYGRLNKSVSSGEILDLDTATCNFLGYVDKFGAAPSVKADMFLLAAMTSILGLILM